MISSSTQAAFDNPYRQSKKAGEDLMYRYGKEIGAVDLVKIIFFADSEGKFHSYPQRKIFSIVDGIIGEEKEGPLIPDSKKSGVVIAGFNPIAVDIGATRLMGLDWTKLKTYTELIKNEDFNFFLDDLNKIKL